MNQSQSNNEIVGHNPIRDCSIHVGSNVLYRIGAYQFLTTILFVALQILPNSIFLFPLQLISGFCSIIIFPGFLLNQLFIPIEYRNIGTIILVACVITLFEIQIAFTITLLTGFVFPLYVWVVGFNSIVFMIAFYRLLQEENISSDSVIFSLSSKLNQIAVIALILRVIMLYFGQNSIGPDAALYADYARNMLEGDFSSSILNDVAVQTLWNGVQYVWHQGFVYFTGLSWLLFEPTAIGTNILLVIIGTLLLYPVYTITDHFFGTKAAYYTSILVAIHPLFIYHSAIGYGPEIVSLFFLLYAAIFLILGREKGVHFSLLSGVIVGLIDVIWYANFYIFCILLPFALLFFKFTNWFDTILFGVNLCVILAIRLFLSNIQIVIIGILVIIVLNIIGTKISSYNVITYAPFLTAVLSTMFFWKWSTYLTQKVETPDSGRKILDVIFGYIDPIVLLRFAFFVFFHLTPILFGLLIWTLLRKPSRVTTSFFTIGLLGAVGTLKVFGLFSKDTLLPYYLYSDSRFFLFIIIMFIIGLGPILINFKEYLTYHLYEKTLFLKISPEKRDIMITFGIIAIGFIPSVLVFPVGLDLINGPERYGWTALDEKIESLDADAIYLCDRAREFTWFTRKQSVQLRFSETYLPDLNSSRELLTFVSLYHTKYLLVDDYFYQHWHNLEFLYLGNMSVGTRVFLNFSSIPYSNILDSEVYSTSLTLVAKTEPNKYGRYARIFEFGNSSLTRVWNEIPSDQEWTVSAGGAIENRTDSLQFILGPNQSKLHIARSEGNEVNTKIQQGFLILDFSYAEAQIESIKVWNHSDYFVSSLDYLGAGRYYGFFTNTTISNITITVSGNPGDSIILKGGSIWDSHTLYDFPLKTYQF
ncbi:MAG: membrane protein of unknown function [Candidatus Thorarchaeota archaeon]|nr:MAG: membrane protein of unknown function [Candidatus Thorarchaeota archaeon]